LPAWIAPIGDWFASDLDVATLAGRRLQLDDGRLDWFALLEDALHPPSDRFGRLGCDKRSDRSSQESGRIVHLDKVRGRVVGESEHTVAVVDDDRRRCLPEQSAVIARRRRWKPIVLGTLADPLGQRFDTSVTDDDPIDARSARLGLWNVHPWLGYRTEDRKRRRDASDGDKQRGERRRLDRRVGHDTRHTHSVELLGDVSRDDCQESRGVRRRREPVDVECGPALRVNVQHGPSLGSVHRSYVRRDDT
jgi:hypothetical protein